MVGEGCDQGVLLCKAGVAEDRALYVVKGWMSHKKGWRVCEEEIRDVPFKQCLESPGRTYAEQIDDRPIRKKAQKSDLDSGDRLLWQRMGVNPFSESDV